MEPKFDDENRFMPDFYLLGGHGCGRLSLSYYLSWLGAPVVPEMGFGPARSAKKDIFLPVPKNPVTYCYGLTVDRPTPDMQPLTREANDTPALWLVRDPIQMLASVFNYFLGDAVFGKGNVETLADNAVIPFLSKHISVCCMFATLKNCINSKSKPFVIKLGKPPALPGD